MEELKKIQQLSNTIVLYAMQNKDFLIKKDSLKGLNTEIIRSILEELPCVIRTRETNDGIVVMARNPIL